jgi:hypothetical protein
LAYDRKGETQLAAQPARRKLGLVRASLQRLGFRESRLAAAHVG